MPIDLSIVIPAYNRADILKYTLESVHYAIADLNIEIIVVDDGSKEPLSEQLQDFLNLPIRFIRQVNQGSIVARNRGLREAIGDYVLFLDSDDLVHPDKLSAQVRCLNQTNAEVCYTDEAIAQLKGDYASLVFQPNRVLPSASRAAEFYLKIQPLPCNPIYKRSYLQQHLATPMISENRIFDPVGDVWLYYNLAAYPVEVVKLDQYYSVYGEHDQDRYTDHWEMLGVASLALMLTFIKKCPAQDSTLEARRLAGECAFISWRKLPRNFNRLFERKMLEVWKCSPRGDLGNLGGSLFQTLAKLIGTSNAAWMLRYLQRPDYSKIQTVSREELTKIVAGLSNI